MAPRPDGPVLASTRVTGKTGCRCRIAPIKTWAERHLYWAPASTIRADAPTTIAITKLMSVPITKYCVCPLASEGSRRLQTWAERHIYSAVASTIRASTPTTIAITKLMSVPITKYSVSLLASEESPPPKRKIDFAAIRKPIASYC